MKASMFHIAAGCACLLIGSFSQAATLIINNGQLTGANNIDVNGVLYDVTFVDGSFDEVFGTTLMFDANNDGEALSFSNALLSSVLIGIYDTDPELTLGCTQTDACSIFTSYSNSNGFVISRQTVNLADGGVDYVSTSSVNENSDFNNFPGAVIADWSISTVPIPAAAWLFGSGLLGLVGVARRKKTA